MKSLFFKLVSMVLVISMILSFAVTTAVAADGVSAFASSNGDVFYKDKQATDLYGDDYTDVTLTVGGESKDYSSDIVMIIGRGPSTNYEYLIETIRKMLIATDGTETKIKLGLVTFADDTEREIVLPLTVMKDTDPDDQAEDDMDYIIAQACQKTYDNYSGVNLSSALATARDMLKADTEVPADRKHMIVVSTGLTYWFDNDAGTPSFIVRDNAGGVPQQVNYKYWLQHRNGTTSTSSGYRIPTSYKTETNTWADAFESYWDDIVSWVEKDQNKYVYSVRDNFTDFTSRAGKNATIVDKDDLALVNKVDGKYVLAPYCSTMDSVTLSEGQHAVGYERAQYEAWVVYNEMQTPAGQTFTTALGKNVMGLGYNCYAIANGVSSNPGEEDVWLESNQIGYNFMRMLGGENAVNWRDHADFFKPIENKILYSLSAGSYVEDYIGYSDDVKTGYNYDFVDNAENLLITVASTKYTATKVENADPNATSTYNFAASGSDVASFTLEYYRGNGTTDERFIWSINENVSKYAPASLTYTLQLVDRKAETGHHVTYTNQRATLYPIDSEGNKLSAEDFPIPELKYENVNIDPIDVVISGTKVFGNNSPEGFEFALVENGDVIRTATSDENGNFTFDAIEYEAAGEFTYTVKEIAGNDAQIIYDTSEYTVKVNVTKEKYELFSEVTFEKNGNTESELVFENRLVDPIKVSINGEKTFESGSAKGFIFQLKDSDDELVAEAISGGDGRFEFELVYDNVGTYNYTISEVNTGDEHIIYDEKIINVTIVVTREGDELVYSVTADRDIDFFNKYIDPVDVTVDGKKIFEDGSAEGFIFQLKDEAGNVIAEATSDADGKFAFDLSLNKIDTYYYTISEANTGDDHIIYDEKVINVTVVVTREGNELVYSMITDSDIVFENKYVDPVDVTVDGEKIFENGSAEDFVFQLKDSDDELVAEATSDADGKFAFNLSFDKIGTYKYTVSEYNDGNEQIVFDTTVVNVTVVVTREGNELVATVSTDKETVFVNKNTKPAEITIVGDKYLDGEFAEGFEFIIREGNDVIQTVYSDEIGLITFGPFVYNVSGEYKYSISEIADRDREDIIYDDTVYDITVIVERVGDEFVATVYGADAIEFYNETVAPETEEEETVVPEETTGPEDEIVEIPDEDVPLGSAPSEDDLVEIPDEDVPLGAPQTSDKSVTALMIMALMASLAACGLLFTKKLSAK